LISLKNIGHL